jgi:hypothetical protein
VTDPTTTPADDGAPTDGSAPTDAATPTIPAPSPGERRLAHPPSDRYRAAEARVAATAEAPDPSASVARGAALASVVGILGAAAIVVFGGVLAVSAGLVVLAAATGWLVALVLKFGAGDHLSRRRTVALAVGLTLAAIALGQLGLWQYGRSEGGVLSLFDFLAEVYGPLVPFEFVLGAGLAWFAAR